MLNSFVKETQFFSFRREQGDLEVVQIVHMNWFLTVLYCYSLFIHYQAF